MNNNKIKLGHIETICGPMFSGKTEELIRRLREAINEKHHVIIFKPEIDKRYSDDNLIISHNNNSIKANLIKKEKEIISLSKKAEVIGIDEIQFFSKEIIGICIKLANQGKRIIVSGLDKDYRGMPFRTIPKLLCESEYITKLNAICNSCGNPAFFSKRISKDKKQILVGKSDKYEANCRNCFYK